MSASNGVIRIGKKGIKKFAFGEDGEPFEVDVVVAWQRWRFIDESFRPEEVDANDDRLIPLEQMETYHQAAVEFVMKLSGNTGIPVTKQGSITTAEALDFIARLREQYTELADFFRPKSLAERESPGTSEAPSLRFSVEGASPTSTN